MIDALGFEVMEIADVTAAVMTPLVDQEFALIGHDVHLVLREVDERSGGNGSRQPFALLFEGPTETLLQQGQWSLRCGEHDISLFLVPVGPQPSGAQGYEAIFS